MARKPTPTEMIERIERDGTTVFYILELWGGRTYHCFARFEVAIIQDAAPVMLSTWSGTTREIDLAELCRELAAAIAYGERCGAGFYVVD